ncbi:NHLP family bacteriocin export ABC transporter peptidase/permease/ATPase subunit [Nostoc sp. UHCC 0302]|uniref:NHLP family bacteriocin export ABC transporter peptidase/permease/ATPase subunit n=1 Tax=Nostoc sp. UHCC 0302 TaxID=3134896 RepID=UPI00311CB5A5
MWQNLKNLRGHENKRYRTPTLVQMEIVECGAAALGIILAYWGRIVPLTELRQACGVSRDGVSAANILKAARNYQLSTKSFKTNLAGLRQLKPPYIIFWKFNHFLVVEGFSKGQVYLNDPASGRRSVSLEEFNGAYTGIVLVLEPTPEFMPGGDKPSTVLALWSRLKSSTGALIYCIVAGFLLVIPGLAMPAFSQIFIDNILIEHRDEWLRPLILGMLLTAGVNGFLSLLQLQFLRQLKIKLSVGMNSRFVWHILSLPMSFYDQRFAGEISSRVSLNDSIAVILSGKLATTVIAAVTVFLYLVVMLQYDIVLTAIALVFVAVNLGVLQWFRRWRTDVNIKLLQEYGKVNGVAISGLQSIETLKASGLESDFFSKWAGHYTKAINTSQELESTNQILGILPSFLSATASMLILAVGGWRVMDGSMSIGMLIAFQGMMQRFLAPVSSLVNLGSDLQQMEGNLNRLDDVLAHSIDRQLQQEKSFGVKSEEDNYLFPGFLPKLQGYVELRNVTFGYSQIAPPLLENLNLSLQPGQRVAIVGSSGSGKSTIAKLLCGLYESWQGEIRFDGKSKDQISRQILANSISVVEQEILMFAGSIRDNLTLWDTTIPNTQLVRACQDAALHNFIISLPHGYDSNLLEGAVNLSGGQRQRLEIARALVNNPSILILDEATSALDAQTEKIVSRNLRLRGCTCIIVAHRLSTIRDCDEIIVLEQGRIVQRGTHNQLNQIEGLYSQLIRSQQAEGFGEAPEADGAEGEKELLNNNSVSSRASKISCLPNFNGQNYNFQNNQLLLLDEPQTIWLVKSGYLGIFAIALDDGVQVGTRRYLFSATAGQMMFAVAPPKDGQHFQMLAVALEDTELVKISRAEFTLSFANAPSEALTLIEQWIEQIGTALVDIISPPTSISLSDSNHFYLSNNQIFGSQDHVLWIRLLQGRARWMGFEELPLTSAFVILPLAANMWFQADETVEVETIAPLENFDLDSLLNSLSQLQTYFLNCINLLQYRQIDTELLRFQNRERLERQVMQATLTELASVLQYSQGKTSNNSLSVTSIKPLDPNQALLVAAGAVGKALGIKIRSPNTSQNLQQMQDSVEAIARATHIRVRRIKLPKNWWRKDCGPMLGYTLEGNLPVALLPVSDNRYELYTPGEQRRITVDAQIATGLVAPTAYVFYRPFPSEQLKTFGLLRFALQGHYKELIIMTLTGISVTLLGMLTPQATAILIDKAIPDANRNLLSQISFSLLAAAFGGMLFQLAQGLATIRLETFADSSTQAAVWDRFLNLKADFFRSFSVGDLNSRVTAISQIRQRLGNTVLKTIFSSLFSLLNLGLLFYYSPILALGACVMVLINVAITIISGILIVRKVRPLLDLQGQVFGLMVQLVNSVAKLRVAKAETLAFAYWGKQYTQQLKLMLSTKGIEDSLTVVNQVLPTLTTAALFWFSTNLIGQSQTPGGNSLSIGTFLAFNVAFGTFISGITSLSNTVVEVLQILPLWQRAQPILQAQLEINSRQIYPGKISGKLVVDQLSFRYRDDGPLTLDDICIHAQAGEFIAIVGTSGSGKSTLLRLLLGFESPKSGAIYYDGQDLASLDVHAVRRQLGVVMQNNHLMSASIFDNIACGAVLTFDQAWEAARMAGLADDIAAMPMQMHTVVSEGGNNISGGQRQRLLIARALALKPQILLFDEATSALDNQTQAIVNQSLDELQVTRIVIAHRLSTIRNAHRIYVLQVGRVVQQGTFQELATTEGLFAQLMARQMQ